MSEIVDEIRAACARVVDQARYVSINLEAIPAYAASLVTGATEPPPDPIAHLLAGTREELTAFWVTLDAINFGSGWFPTLRKREGSSGYRTIAAGLRERFVARGPWTAAELEAIDTCELAASLGQQPSHELMALFADSLRDLGQHLACEHDGRFGSLLQAAAGSAVKLTELLGEWECFADSSTYAGFRVPFLKRAQIAAADVCRAGVTDFGDLDQLTMFADNLVPHVLRLDGVLRYDSELIGRIDRGELIAHGSPEEVEIRACALHAVELIAASAPAAFPAELDQLLWQRGGEPRYKASPRHRSRCTAY